MKTKVEKKDREKGIVVVENGFEEKNADSSLCCLVTYVPIR